MKMKKKMILMTKEELEYATDIIIDRIIESELSNYTKIELMINLKTFLKDYENNIRELNKIEKRKIRNEIN